MGEIIDRTLGPEIEVKVASTAGLWPVLADAPQLKNALLNLSTNARDAMPEGGRLTIETANRPLDARSAADPDLAGAYVSLCVTDTGMRSCRQVGHRYPASSARNGCARTRPALRAPVTVSSTRRPPATVR